MNYCRIIKAPYDSIEVEVNDQMRHIAGLDHKILTCKIADAGEECVVILVVSDRPPHQKLARQWAHDRPADEFPV